ncbi:hypothetical protein GOBAR_DD17286 [Gossypium barbadense]|nr:hypothetical protein GOBAR_DD17286 [Gossypium barbadense]
MELVDDEDVETMVALYCETRSNQNAPIQLFTELAGVKATEDPNPLGEDGVQAPCMVVPLSYIDSQSTIHVINIDLNTAPETDVVGDDVHYLLTEWPYILIQRSCSWARDLKVRKNAYLPLSAHKLEPHIFRQRMARLESDIEGQTNTSFRQWLGTIEPWQWAQSFDEGFHYSQMNTNLVEGINAVLLKTRHLPISSVFSATFYRLTTLMPRMGQQQVNQMEAGHVFVEDVRDAMVGNRRKARSMTVEVYSRYNETFRVTETIGRRPGIPPRSYRVDLRNRRTIYREVYTIERTLRVWENEFPMLPDLSTLEVPPTTFELVLNKMLRRNPKGLPQSSRIHNEMDIREKPDGKLCGICRLAAHNQSKCSLRNYHVGQSSQSGRN